MLDALVDCRALSKCVAGAVQCIRLFIAEEEVEIITVGFVGVLRIVIHEIHDVSSKLSL